MKILTVIPIAKGIPRDELSYFSAKPVSLGMLVTAPFGKRTIKGVVVNNEDVRDLKGSIKQSNFALRNITTIHSNTILAHSIFSAAQKTAEFFATRVGPILETMLPNQVFDYYISHPSSLQEKRIHNPNIQSIQVPHSERVSMYKTLIRENLAKHVSTLIVVPTVAHAEQFAELLATGITEKLVVLHSKKTKKHIEKSITTVLEQKNPVCVIATAPFTTLVRNDWDTIIIEESSSSYYRYGFGPIFDMRFFVEYLAKDFGSRLIYADTLLDTTIHARIKHREIFEMRTTWHIKKPEDFTIIDMKAKSDKQELVKKTFSVLHETTYRKLEESLAHQFSALLLTTRKGIAPVTVCSDCGTLVSCPQCGAALVLHRKKNKDVSNHETRTYMCHHCMYTTPPYDRCQVCTSWKLTLLGISTDSIRMEIEEQFPTIPIYVCDGDTSTPASLTKAIALWKKSPSILIATPMVLPYITNADFGCIVSMDSLLSLPTYTGSEHGLHTALTFLEKNVHTAIIQTRSLEHDVMHAIAHESIFEFMNNEIESRTLFGYPPTKALIKISCEVPQAQAVNASASFEKMFQEWSPDILAKRSKQPESIIIQTILKIDSDYWKTLDTPLRLILKEIMSDCIIEVNPESIL
ncbi:MAG: hypothetical protein WCG20_03270 [bacterium]